MIISKKRFEKEVRERTEQELKKFYEMREREDRERDFYRMLDRLQMRIEKVEEKVGIPTNLTACL